MRNLTHVLEDYELELDERFEGAELDPARWIPAHLPQWSSRELAAARFRLTRPGLELRIDPDQPPWCPELDGTTRVSSLQTGVFAGPLGSAIGQHRFDARAVVREEQESRRLFTPRYGVFEMRARAELDAQSMAALWMIGFEDAPERAAEICIAEIFGKNAASDRAAVGMGVHPFGDPAIVDEFAEVPVEIDVREPHGYAACWTAEDVTFYVDGRPVRRVAQSPAYPMQFMLGIYAFDPPGSHAPSRRRFAVEWFRAYHARPRG